MGRKNTKYRKTLHQAAYDRLTKMQAFGESKQAAIRDGSAKGKIFSYSTYKSYWKITKRFLRDVKREHPSCTSLREAKRYVRPWLEAQADRGLSAWTLHTEAAALTKLFQIDLHDSSRYIPPTRRRCDIKRSRIPVERDRHFSEENNLELIRFCRATGCRRNVLERLEGRDLWSRRRIENECRRLRKDRFMSDPEGKQLKMLEEALTVFPDAGWFVHHRKDKGGRSRMAPILGTDQEQVIARFRVTEPQRKVWPSVNRTADIHSYRADYAAAVYRHYARDLNKIPYDAINRGSGRRYQSDIYVCRGDEAGKRYDREALKKASKALGHNRVSVVAENYLHNI